MAFEKKWCAGMSEVGNFNPLMHTGHSASDSTSKSAIL